MTKVHCDRCGESCGTIYDSQSFYEKCQSFDAGVIFGAIYQTIKHEDPVVDSKWSNDYKTIDLCDKCQKELDELLFKFMKSN